MSTRHLQEHGVTWDEDGQPQGFQVGRAAALLDWQARREGTQDPEFKRLVWRLQARNYWAAKAPERKARIYQYREEWRRRNYEHVRALHNAWRRARRADPEYWARELAKKRARHAAKSAARRAATIYTCEVCGKQWGPDPKKRIPTNPPKYCSTRCHSKAQYRRHTPEQRKEHRRRAEEWRQRKRAEGRAQAEPTKGTV
jgi:hypothetical protein